MSYYPSSPKSIDITILKPSKEYRANTSKVFRNILLFIVTYIVLFCLAIGLALVISYLGITVISIRPMFFTFIVGIGMITAGLMIVYFLVKFVFSSNKKNNSALFEIKPSDYPELYVFIKKVAEETKSQMPKKIYLTPDVNACVFYNSSFLSLIFPARKNLLIGLGLVNSVNLSEFKAVLAHEFGHFSQHSMMLGSYVYYVNQIIHDMLFENESYDELLARWVNISRFFIIFAQFTVKIVVQIQKILREVYVQVNKSNMALSREMEHHADTVAASVCGPKAIISGLNRTEFSAAVYYSLLERYDELLKENIVPQNIFIHHTQLMTFFASQNNIEMIDDLPVIKAEAKINRSRIHIKEKQLSHPNIIDRERFIHQFGIEEIESLTISPWILFGDVNKVQTDVTDKMFSTHRRNRQTQIIDENIFNDRILSPLKKHSLNSYFREYYTQRPLSEVDVNECVAQNLDSNSESELFSDKYTELVHNVNSIDSDIATLHGIASQQSEIINFEFDNVKHHHTDVPALIEKLEEEKHNLQEQIKQHDAKIISIVLHKASDEEKDTFLNLLNKYYHELSFYNDTAKLRIELPQLVAPFYKENWKVAEVEANIVKIKQIEVNLIEKIEAKLNDIKNDKDITIEQIEIIEKYLSSDKVYYLEQVINYKKLDLFGQAIYVFVEIISENEFKARKEVLDAQYLILIKDFSSKN